ISKKLGNTTKIVSLQGDVINAGGSVTGGHISNNQNLLGRKREIEECKQNIDKSSKLLNERNNLLNSILASIKSHNEEIASIKNNINDKNNTYSMNISKINMLREQAEKTSQAIKKYSEEMQFIKNEKEKYENDLKNIFIETERLKKLIDEKEKSIE